MVMEKGGGERSTSSPVYQYIEMVDKSSALLTIFSQTMLIQLHCASLLVYIFM